MVPHGLHCTVVKISLHETGKEKFMSLKCTKNSDYTVLKPGLSQNLDWLGNTGLKSHVCLTSVYIKISLNDLCVE